VLAHPERNAEVQAAPGRLEPLVHSGTLIQLTAASVSGALGRRCQATALRLLELGLAHLLSSDIHARGGRAGLAAAVKELSDETLAQWLTTDVPKAIVSDEALPLRPPRRRSRPWKGR
jgi:protein-tyrosine phosphatase